MGDGVTTTAGQGPATTEGALEPLFFNDWSGQPMPTYEFTSENAWRIDVFRCGRCGALTDVPARHWAWHGKVDTNTTAEV